MPLSDMAIAFAWRGFVTFWPELLLSFPLENSRITVATFFCALDFFFIYYAAISWLLFGFGVSTPKSLQRYRMWKHSLRN